MNNRYTSLSFSNLNDLPKLQLPYQQLDELLGQKQGQIDLFNASTDLAPDYRRDSPDDRALAGRLTQYQQSLKDQLKEIAASGNVNEYTSALSQAQNQIKRLYSPGGAADILKQRKLQAEAEDKRLDEQYKDNPAWADYFKKNRQYNKVGYDVNTGAYQPMSSLGNTPNYITPKEFDEFVNRNLDNIKDSLISEGVSKQKLDGITTLYDFYKIKGVSQERIANALMKVMPPEYIQSAYTEHEVNRFYNPNLPELDTRMTIEDKDGKTILNPNNPIANKIQGYAEIGARMNKENQRIKDDNEIALAKYKHDLDNPYTPPTSGYTEGVTNPYLKEVKPIKVENGKLKPTDKFDIKYPDPRTAGRIGAEKYGQDRPQLVPRSELSEKEVDIVNSIKSRYLDLYGKDLTDAQAAELYNTAIEDRKSTAITFEQINDPKTLKNLNDRVLGSEKKILNIGVRPVYFLDSNGKISTPTNAQGAIDRLGTEILDKGIEGKISADNPLGLPTGDYATAIDKNGKFVTVVIGNRSIEEDQHFSILNQMSKSKYSLEPEIIRVRDKHGRLTGEIYETEPIIDMQEDEKGNVQYRGVDVKVKKYDVNGNLVSEAPLKTIEDYIKQTNPYK